MSCKPCSSGFHRPLNELDSRAGSQVGTGNNPIYDAFLLDASHCPAGDQAQAQEVPNLGGPAPLEGMARTNPPVLDPMFQQRRLSLENSPSSSYSLQNFIAQQQQQQQQQMYMQHNLTNVPQFPMPQPVSAGMPLRGHPLAPGPPAGGPFPPAVMSFGYSSLRTGSAGSMPEFNANPGAGLPYGGYPTMRQPYTPFAGSLTGHEPAWGQGESMTQLQRTMSQDYHQQQQQVHHQQQQKVHQHWPYGMAVAGLW